MSKKPYVRTYIRIVIVEMSCMSYIASSLKCILVAYTSLLKEMWSPEASSISVAPTSFKGQIQKYAKRFVGYE